MAAVAKRLAGNVITVFNGNGFVAQNVIARLGRNGAQIVVGYRGSRYDDEKIRIAGGLGQLYYSQYHMKDDRSLYETMKHSNVVINTTGKLNETRNFSFKDVHVDGPRRMARIAREAGVEKFIHFSSLNAHPNPPSWGVLKKGSQFLKSKYEGELAVREEFPNAIIFRPADILGDKDSFINHFLMMARSRYTGKLALWDYYDGVTKVPIFIQDLCAGVEAALIDATAEGKTFQAVGPHRYDFCELIEYMRTCGGQSAKYDGCTITNLRWDIIMRLATTVIERIQKYPLITWERMEKDSTPDYVDPKLPTLKDLGVQLTPLEHWIQVLGHYRPREHRFEIPYESALRIDLPKRMELVQARFHLENKMKLTRLARASQLTILVALVSVIHQAAIVSTLAINNQAGKQAQVSEAGNLASEQTNLEAQKQLKFETPAAATKRHDGTKQRSASSVDEHADDMVPLATVNNHSRNNQNLLRPPQYVDVSALVGNSGGRNISTSGPGTFAGSNQIGANLNPANSLLTPKSRSGLPECATQQVCNAIFVRMNHTQRLCECSSNYNWKCSNNLDPQDGHTIELTRKFDKRIYTQIKTCEPLREVRACKSPTDWTLLALQSERSGKAHYVVVCKCPTWAQLEGPYTHNHPPYANIPGIRVYGMLCAHQTARSSSAQTYSAYNPALNIYPEFPWSEALNVLNTTNLANSLDGIPH